MTIPHTPVFNPLTARQRRPVDSFDHPGTRSGGVARLASIVALAAAALFLALLGALHVLKPELDASWRLVSEYAIGNHGWMMALAFLSLAIGCAALGVALWAHLGTIAGRIGIAMLIVTAAGLTLAAMFTTDPLNAPPAQRTSAGRLHELAAMLDLIPYAALLIGWSLARGSPKRLRLRWVLAGAAAVVVGATAWFAIAIALLLPADGTFGPDVAIGWPNRIMIVSHAAWVMMLAWLSTHLDGPIGVATDSGDAR
jgi:hypothetical protein